MASVGVEWINNFPPPCDQNELSYCDDTSVGAALPVSHETLGAKMAELLAKGNKTDWFRPFRSGGTDVELHRRRGFITCPWAAEEFTRCTVGAGSRATGNEFMIRKSSRIEGFEISVHLIRDHGFFGGPGTPFRIEPENLAEVVA